MGYDHIFKWTTGVDGKKKRFDRLKMPNGVYWVMRDKGMWRCIFKPTGGKKETLWYYQNKTQAMLSCENHSQGKLWGNV